MSTKENFGITLTGEFLGTHEKSGYLTVAVRTDDSWDALKVSTRVDSIVGLAVSDLEPGTIVRLRMSAPRTATSPRTGNSYLSFFPLDIEVLSKAPPVPRSLPSPR